MNRDPIAVIHIIAQLRFGAGRYVVDTAIEQAKGLKHRVMVGVSEDADEHWRTDPKLAAELAGCGIEVRTMGDFFHRRPDWIQKSAALLREAIESIKGETIVHAHTAMAAAAGHWAKPDRLVATCHGWAANRPPDIDLQDALAYQLCDSVVTYSNHWADRLARDLAVADPKIVLMGLNMDKYPKLVEKDVAERRPIRIVTVCELTPRKGVDLLLKAMPRVWKEMAEAELHILGHGDAAEDLRRLAAKTDPAMKRIVFHGTVADPYRHLVDFDLFVLASRSDNLPVVLLEAMLAGLPIVSTRVGGIPEIISAGKCGTVVAPDSADALAGEMIGVLKVGRTKLRSMGLRGEAYARRELDVRKTAVDLEKIYLHS